MAGAAALLIAGGSLPASWAVLHERAAALWVWQAESRGLNPDPVRLWRPRQQPLSAMAALGRAIYFDADLSISRQRSCASCHSPAHAYGPPDDRPVQFGGADLRSQGTRAVPSLTYLSRLRNFSLDAEDDGDAGPSRPVHAVAPATNQPRQRKAAGSPSNAVARVPQGGLFWDGRADTLQSQAAGPLFNPAEMGNTDAAAIATTLSRAAYHGDFAALFGPRIFTDTQMTLAEALFAIARYQIEEASFHPYTSKFDYWLEGKARFSSAEMRGYRAFNDPQGGNCAGCHLDQPGRDGTPPLFTDNEYEALAVPRNAGLAVNRDPAYFDLGICGPIRTDLRQQTQYCGMFRTPSLRNVAIRGAFFHNGRYHTLREVLEFYDFRDIAPDKIYPRHADGSIAVYDDLPPQYRGNVDVTDAPFDRKPGDQPSMSGQDIDDIIAFLKTLSDGYQPGF